MRAVVAALVAAAATACSAGSTAAPSAVSTLRHAGTSSSSAAPSRAATTTATTATTARTVLHLPVGVSRAVAVMMSGRIVVLGGLAPGDSSTSRIWSVDLAGRRVTRAGSLSLAVHDASGAVLHGAAFVFGGGSATTVATVQEWDGRRTRVVGSLPAPRSDSAAAVIGGVAYIVGGFDGSRLVRDVLATTDGRHFRTVARLRVGVRYPAVVADGRDLLVAGGALATTEGTAAGPVTAAVQQVDVATGIVSVVGRLDRPMAHGVGCVVGGRPLVVGGRSGGRPLDAIVEPRSRRRAGTLPVALSDGACASAGSVGYVVGGESSGPGAPLRSVIALTAR